MSETRDERCHWNGTGRVLRTHAKGCELAGCDGCEECPKRHCAGRACSNHLRDHEPRRCDKCVGKVRTNLARIRDLCTVAPYALAEANNTSRVAVLVGPVPERSTHEARRTWAIRGGLCRCVHCPDLEPLPEGPMCDKWKGCEHLTCRRRSGRATCPDLAAWLDQADDEQHPLWVLGWWDMAVAEHFGHTRTMRVTVESAVGYLSANLTDLARHDDFGFDELAREVEDCRDHVEDVLSVAPRRQKGAPCPVCHASGRKAKELVREYAENEPNDALDLWACPTAVCGQTWTIDEYDKYVAREHVKHAERLTASQIAAEYRIAEGTLRTWAARGKVRKYGVDMSGRQLYDVADALRMRDGNAA